MDKQPERFNDQLISQKEKAARVQESLLALRGHCHTIKKHADALDKTASTLKSRVLLLIGVDSAERDHQVAAALNRIYDDETDSYRLVQQLTTALRLALDDISQTLGPSGTMDPKNVPAAAELLGEYAKLFEPLESESNYLVFTIQDAINELHVQ
jgi:hypothetical protein